MAKYHGLPYKLMVSKNLTKSEKEALHKALVGSHMAGEARKRANSRYWAKEDAEEMARKYKPKGGPPSIDDILSPEGADLKAEVRAKFKAGRSKDASSVSRALAVAPKSRALATVPKGALAEMAAGEIVGQANPQALQQAADVIEDAKWRVTSGPVRTARGVGAAGAGGTIYADGAVQKLLPRATENQAGWAAEFAAAANPSKWGTALKWGGRALGGIGLVMTALQIMEGIRKEREGGIVDALRGLDEGSKAAQLEMALQSEQSLNSRLGVMEGAAGRLERDAATRQGFDEAELMGMLRDRAGELDAIAERYQPDLATRMARLGVL